MQNIQKLSGGRFNQSDYLIGRYAARVPSGTTMDDVLHPEYWQNHLAQMKPGMEINVLSDDFALDCDLRVLTVTKTTTKMRVLRHTGDVSVAAKPGDVSAIEVNWGGPQHKWRFIHAGEVIEKGFSSESEAKEAANKYEEMIKG